MPLYEELVCETEEARREFMRIPTLRLGMRGEISRTMYLAFLTQAYHHVRHTVPLLMACGARLPDRLAWLRGAVTRYITEESGHEEWILNDIDACGGDAGSVRTTDPHPSTDLMVAYAYDTIARCNPVGFFGMVLVLESTSVQLALKSADAIQSRLRLPDRAFSYLRTHGTLDREHIQFFSDIINRLGEAEDRRAVSRAAAMFYRLYGDIFRALPAH
jgi:pyrroloquinoline quinone (PQQ) biosynthesis protein C